MPLEQKRIGTVKKHEEEQFNTIVKILDDKFKYKKEKYYLISNINVGDAEIDALLLSTFGVILLEFKNYEGELEITDNQWTIRNKGNECVVKGGSGDKTPEAQARINSSIVKKRVKEITGNDIYVPVIIVFNKDVKIDPTSKALPEWLSISTNDKVSEEISKLLKKTCVLTSGEICKIDEKLGISAAEDNVYEKAFNWFKYGDYQECDKLLRGKSGNEEKILRAKALSKLYRVEEAKNILIAMNDSPEAYLELGNILKEQNKIQESLNAYQDAIEMAKTKGKTKVQDEANRMIEDIKKSKADEQRLNDIRSINKRINTEKQMISKSLNARFHLFSKFITYTTFFAIANFFFEIMWPQYQLYPMILMALFALISISIPMFSEGVLKALTNYTENFWFALNQPEEEVKGEMLKSNEYSHDRYPVWNPLLKMCHILIPLVIGGCILYGTKILIDKSFDYRYFPTSQILDMALILYIWYASLFVAFKCLFIWRQKKVGYETFLLGKENTDDDLFDSNYSIKLFKMSWSCLRKYIKWSLIISIIFCVMSSIKDNWNQKDSTQESERVLEETKTETQKSKQANVQSGRVENMSKNTRGNTYAKPKPKSRKQTISSTNQIPEGCIKVTFNPSLKFDYNSSKFNYNDNSVRDFVAEVIRNKSKYNITKIWIVGTTSVSEQNVSSPKNLASLRAQKVYEIFENYLNIPIEIIPLTGIGEYGEVYMLMDVN